MMFRHTTPAITDLQSDAGREHKRLHDRYAEQVATVNALEAAKREAISEARDTEAALGKALQDAAMGDADAAKKADALTKALAKAKARADEPHDVRIRAATAAANAMLGEVGAFVKAHLDDLLEDEFRLAAEAAQARVRSCADQARSAIVEWHGVRQTVTELLGYVQGLDGQALPAFEGALNRVNDLENAVRDAPLPMPHAHLLDDPRAAKVRA